MGHQAAKHQRRCATPRCQTSPPITTGSWQASSCWPSPSGRLYRTRKFIRRHRLSALRRIANSGLPGTPRTPAQNDPGRLLVGTRKGVFYVKVADLAGFLALRVEANRWRADAACMHTNSIVRFRSDRVFRDHFRAGWLSDCEREGDGSERPCCRWCNCRGDQYRHKRYPSGCDKRCRVLPFIEPPSREVFTHGAEGWFREYRQTQY